MPEVNVDIVTPDSVQGDVASQMISNGGLSVHDYRPFIAKDGRTYINRMVGNKMKAVPITSNATVLRDREWKELDMAVMKIRRERLIGVDDLTAKGLTYNLTNPMGRTVLEYHDMNDPGSAYMDMDPVNKGENDRPKYSIGYLPLPIIYSDFTISHRVLQASRNMGDAIDTTMVEAATRRVMEKLEDLFFTNTTYAFGGGTIYSYTNYTNKNSVTLSTNWDASAKTGPQILQDVIDMRKAQIAAKSYGDVMLYIPTDYETVLDEDYTSGYAKSVKQRLMELDYIIGIRVVDRLTADTVVMVEMDSKTVRLVNGFSPRVIQWDTQGGMIHNFKVMAIQVPQIRADQDGNTGVTVLA